MKQRIKDFVAKAPGTSLLIAAAAILVVVMISTGIAHLIGERKTDRQINATKTEANAAVNVAVENESNAANSSAERQTEDSYRDSSVRPKLETARRNSNLSKTQLERAREKFNEKTDPHDVNGTWADNCARLKRAFPDTRFEYCTAAGDNPGN